MPWAILAITAIQMGMEFKKGQDMKTAASNAQLKANVQAVDNQNKLIKEGYQERRREQGALSVSQEGGILSPTSTQSRSLIG